jgi:Na+/H+ antiporter NhaA
MELDVIVIAGIFVAGMFCGTTLGIFLMCLMFVSANPAKNPATMAGKEAVE